MKAYYEVTMGRLRNNQILEMSYGFQPYCEDYYQKALAPEPSWHFSPKKLQDQLCNSHIFKQFSFNPESYLNEGTVLSLSSYCKGALVAILYATRNFTNVEIKVFILVA